MLPFQVPPDQLLRGGLEGGHRGRVEGLAEDVLLAAQDDAVAGQVVGAARRLERTGAGRPVRRAPDLDAGCVARGWRSPAARRRRLALLP